jgi:hypothetical protein
MYSAVIRASEKWQRLEVTNFEREMLGHLRQELNDEFKRRHQRTVTAAPSSFSSKVGT